MLPMLQPIKHIRNELVFRLQNIQVTFGTAPFTGSSIFEADMNNDSGILIERHDGYDNLDINCLSDMRQLFMVVAGSYFPNLRVRFINDYVEIIGLDWEIIIDTENSVAYDYVDAMIHIIAYFS